MMKLSIMVKTIAICYIFSAKTSCSAISNSENPVNQMVKNMSFIECDCVEQDIIWQHLIIILDVVFRTQNNLDSFPNVSEETLLVVVLFQDGYFKAATEFTNLVSKREHCVQFVVFELGDGLHFVENLRSVLNLFVANSNAVNSVFVFSDNHTLITSLLKTVASTQQLRFTGILHTTEWIIASTCNKELLVDLRAGQIGLDFMILLFLANSSMISLAQKS